MFVAAATRNAKFVRFLIGRIHPGARPADEKSPWHERQTAQRNGIRPL